jgi:two-component system cell cycle sensor histidine kinase/response regulator CckA
VRRLAARTLRAAGYDVIEAEDGAQGRARAAELGEAIDLVLSDVVMPRLSGPALIRAIRSDRPDLPVVLMSGYPDAAEGDPIPDDVVLLLKPFGPDRLRDAVARALHAKHGGDADPA